MKSRGCPKKKWARQDKVETQLFKHFEKILCPDKEIAEWIIESRKAKHQNDMFDYSSAIAELRKQIDSKTHKLDLLYDDRLSERITLERYEQLEKQITAEKKQLETDVQYIGANSRDRLKTGIDVMEKSQQAAKIYKTLSPEAKRKLLSELFDSLFLDGPLLNVTYNPYTEVISKRAQKHRAVERSFRKHKNTPDNRGKSELVEALRTVWRARPDSNRRSSP